MATSQIASTMPDIFAQTKIQPEKHFTLKKPLWNDDSRAKVLGSDTANKSRALGRLSRENVMKMSQAGEKTGTEDSQSTSKPTGELSWGRVKPKLRFEEKNPMQESHDKVEKGAYSPQSHQNVQTPKVLALARVDSPITGEETVQACDAIKLFFEYYSEGPYVSHKAGVLDALIRMQANPRLKAAFLSEFAYYGIFPNYAKMSQKYGPETYVNAMHVMKSCSKLDELKQKLELRGIPGEVGQAVFDDGYTYLRLRLAYAIVPNSIQRDMLAGKVNEFLKNAGSQNRIDAGFFRLVRAGELTKIPGETGLTPEEAKSVLNYLSRTTFEGLGHPFSLVPTTRSNLLTNRYDWERSFDEENATEAELKVMSVKRFFSDAWKTIKLIARGGFEAAWATLMMYAVFSGLLGFAFFMVAFFIPVVVAGGILGWLWKKIRGG